MKMQMQDGPRCLIFSAAMCLNVKASELIAETGYTGLEVWWPGKQIPQCYRGHHIQEINYCAARRKKIFGEFLRFPMMGESESCAMPMNMNRRDDLVPMCRVLNGRTAIINTATHAVAWDGIKVFDPRGRVYSLEVIQAQITAIYVLGKL